MRYAITNLSEAGATSPLDVMADRRMRWVSDLRRWTVQGVNFVQLREKPLEAGEIFSLAQAAQQLLGALPEAAPRPRILVNGRPDLAAAAGAAGVHLTSAHGELRPAQARAVFQAAGLPSCTVSISCHSEEAVVAARKLGADLILFGPVFGKELDRVTVVQPAGLRALGTACRLASPVPVLALGGVTGDRIADCLNAGAAGIAGIRVFADSEDARNQPRSPTLPVSPDVLD